jgi:hypothetical protein
VHGALNHVRHDIAGGENDGLRLDLAIVCKANIDRAPGGVELNRFRLEQPGAARDGRREQPMRQPHGIGVCRAGGYDRSGTRDAEVVEQHAVVEKIARQARAGTPAMLLRQTGVALVGREIERILVPHAAGDIELSHQRLQASDRVEAGAIRACGALEAIGVTQFAERPVDFPEQHGGRGGCAATARQFAIDDDDVQPLPRQPLGNQRSRDAGADDQRIAREIVTHIEARRLS